MARGHHASTAENPHRRISVLVSPPYISAAGAVSTLMLKVLAALLPAIAAYVYYFGPAILLTLAIASVFALGAEALMLRLRAYPIKPFLFDGSALVTAWLLALSIPPTSPWWLTGSGTLFAIVIAKHLYGGLGSNLFNPAMVGYAVLLISFPVLMTQWPAALGLGGVTLDLSESAAYIFRRQLPAGAGIDAVSMATPLDTMKTQLLLQRTASEIAGMPIYGAVGGRGIEVLALCYALGGLYLWRARIISWHIPAAFTLTLFLSATLFHVIDADRYTSPWFHLASGGAMLGAFFIATDPVTAATTPRGKLLFGAGVGALTYLIRVFGGYPDGIAFAVLLMNMCAPLIDAYTQPRIFGHKK